MGDTPDTGQSWCDTTSPHHTRLPAGNKMRFLLVVALAVVSVSTEEDEESAECSKFCPHELRATVFDPLMMKNIKFLRTTLEAAIDGLEELEQKTMDVPESMKEKLGLNVGEEEDNDTTGEMRSFLLEQLDSIMSADLRAWDRITDTYLDIQHPERARKAPKTLTDLKSELENLVTSLHWSSGALQPLLHTLGTRLARIFNTLVRMMETMAKLGGEEVMIEKMKEREINNFMGKVLIELLRLKKEKNVAELELNVFKQLETLAEKLNTDFYHSGRKLSSDEFWKIELKYFQSSQLDTASPKEARFVAELVRKYLK